MYYRFTFPYSNCSVLYYHQIILTSSCYYYVIVVYNYYITVYNYATIYFFDVIYENTLCTEQFRSINKALIDLTQSSAHNDS